MRMRTAHAGKTVPHPAALFGVWTTLAVLTYVRRYLQQPPPNQVDFWPQLFLWLACFYPLGLLTPVIFHLEHRFAITRDSWRRNVPILAAASLPVSYAAFLLTVALTFGKNAKKRAVVAVARKLAVLLHRLWVSGAQYDPLRNSRQRAQAAA